MALMPEELDIESFLEKLRQKEAVSPREDFDLTAYLNYKKFAHIEQPRDYWLEIKICKIILNDIKNRSSFLEKLNKYCEGIKNISFSDVKKIRYDAEGESYVIFANNGEYEVYEDDLRFVYPTIIDVPDAAEYEVVIENSGVFVYNKYTDEPALRVPEKTEK